MRLIVGLGNPGKEYERTRHNAGFVALDALAKELDAFWTMDQKRNAWTTKAFADGERIILAKPATFMNRSGEAVKALLSFYKKATPKDLLVVQDDMDLFPGQMAFLAQGGDAGHNGIASIFAELGRKDVSRLRIGVGRPPKSVKPEDWVLGKMSADTRKAIDDAPQAIMDWAEQGLSKAMTAWNRK